MGRLRPLGGPAWAAVAVLVVVPPLALVPAAIVDRGPDGAVRASALPLALAALDPFVWEALRNSAAVAALVALGSWAVGVGLARLAAGWRFWGRGPLWALALAPLAAPPLFGALGLAGALARWDPGRLGILPGWAAAAAPWAAWAWAATAAGVPLVAASARRALARIEPAWEDAAALAGAGRRPRWRILARPWARPEAARAAAAVFALTVLEPGAPLVLGLRRTLAFQVVEAATSADSGARAAALALLGVGAAVAGATLIRWWGGRPWPRPAPPPGSDPSPARPGRARWTRAAGLVGGLGAWVVVAWLPLLGLAALAAVPAWSGAGGSWRPSGRAWRGLADDPEALRLLGRSAALALAVGGINLVVAALVAARLVRRPGMGAAVLGALAKVPAVVPPLAMGVGALMVPWLLGALADGLLAGRSAPMVAAVVRRLAGALDPYAAPGVLLAWAVAAVRLPAMVRAAERGRAAARPVLIDAAVSLGLSRRRARWAVTWPLWWRSVGPALLLTLALSASNVAPALVLEPSSESRTLGPAVLEQSDAPGGGRPRAAALATLGLAVNLAALALSARREAGAEPAG